MEFIKVDVPRFPGAETFSFFCMTPYIYIPQTPLFKSWGIFWGLGYIYLKPQILKKWGIYIPQNLDFRKHDKSLSKSKARKVLNIILQSECTY